MKKSGSTEGQSASERIDKKIAELEDWQRRAWEECALRPPELPE